MPSTKECGIGAATAAAEQLGAMSYGKYILISFAVIMYFGSLFSFSFGLASSLFGGRSLRIFFARLFESQLSV